MASNDYRRTHADFILSLQRHLSLLVGACFHYDLGDLAQSLTIAEKLRLLLKQTPRQTALLHSVSMREGLWFDARAIPQAPVVQSIGDTCTLTELLCGPLGAMVVPRTPIFVEQKEFTSWWNDPVANSRVHGAVSRRLLVEWMGDKEASHVDETLPAAYQALRDGSFMQSMAAMGPNGPLPLAAFHESCVRTIAHETIMSVALRRPHLLLRPYGFRQDPSGVDIHIYRPSRAGKAVLDSITAQLQRSAVPGPWTMLNGIQLISVNGVPESPPPAVLPDP